MKRNPVALTLAVLAFAGWVTWLGVRALGVRRPVIVSLAQLAAADLDVEADLEANPDGSLPKSVVVRAIRWTRDGGDLPEIGAMIDVVNINDARSCYAGEGSYLLPLVRRGKNFALAEPPEDLGLPLERRPIRFYPASADVRRQWDAARGP